MSMSLLAHLYSRIKGSQEDVATLSLQYIVSKSSVLNRDFTRLLYRSMHEDVKNDLNYVCQAVGSNNERPDIAGIDENGHEHLLCEAKFYAGLTQNQPNGYLDRLIQEGGIGLIFICPAVRRVTLWSKLLELCQLRSIDPIDDRCAVVDGIKLAIITWDDIMESLRLSAASDAPELLPDIYQLDGFCKLMDDEAFIPFSSEDFGPENAIREERHYQVVDALFDRLMADKSLHPRAKGLRASPNRFGYVRYIKIKDCGLSIGYDRRLWKSSNSVETPFWLIIMNTDFKQPSDYQNALSLYKEEWKESLNNVISLPLFAPTDVTLDEVATEMANQIVQYIKDLEKSLATKP